jgi:hypothetical protein
MASGRGKDFNVRVVVSRPVSLHYLVNEEIGDEPWQAAGRG